MTTEKRRPKPAVGGDDPRSSAPAAPNESRREDEDLLRGLFETSAAGLVVSDKDGRVVSANPAAERILGLTHSEVEKGATFSFTLPPTEPASV